MTRKKGSGAKPTPTRELRSKAMRAASVEEKQAIEAVTRMDRSEMVQWLRRGHDLLVHWFPG